MTIATVRRCFASFARRAVLAVVALLLLSCDITGTPSEAPIFALSLAASSTGDDVEVRGQSNLPDGALIWVYAWHADEVPDWDWEGTVPVAGGSFRVPIPAGNWGRGLIHVAASFSIVDQPAAVIDDVGPHGERLVGPQVLVDEDGIRYLTAKVDVMHE